MESTSVAVHAVNEFGDVIVRATDGAYWLICPEALSCDGVAMDEAAFATLRATAEFAGLANGQSSSGSRCFGEVSGERCYCLTNPAGTLEERTDEET